MISHAALQTLETLIAPGKRSRLSPFVESAQLKVLFGEFPDESKRSQSVNQILSISERSLFKTKEVLKSKFADVNISLNINPDEACLKITANQRLVGQAVLKTTINLI